MTLELVDTLEKHSDFVDSYAYMVAVKEAKLRESYILVYVKKRPWWMPEFLYKWAIGKVLVLANFNRL